MITKFEFDNGDPLYMSAIDKWTERRDAVWRIHYVGKTVAMYEEVVDWLDNICCGGYDYTYRFNTGNSYLEVEILQEEDAVAFKMRFG